MIPAAGLRRRAGMLVAAMVFMPYYIYSATPESPHIDDLLDIAFVGEPDEDQAFEVTPEIVEELFGEEEVVDVPGTNLITALLFYGTISVSIVTVVSGLLAAALATRIVRPLRQLTNVAHDVARGDLAVRASQRIRGEADPPAPPVARSPISSKLWPRRSLPSPVISMFRTSRGLILSSAPTLRSPARSLRTSSRTPPSTTPPMAGCVRVKVPDGEDGVRLEIENSGPRVEAEDVERLLEPLWRARNAGSKGYGLGLTLVNSITRVHGAELTITARNEGGLHVRIDWPEEPSRA